MPYLCSNPWTTAFVWGNGDVTHCCYSNIGPLGNIYRQSLSDIWAGHKLAYVRRKMRKGDWTAAGCESFCRPSRWQRFYGEADPVPAIPEGLGRLSNFHPENPPRLPRIIGVANSHSCNFNCEHCLAKGNAPGLSEDGLKRIEPDLRQAEILRFVNGEFSVNKQALERLNRVSGWREQPTVFMNSNGHIGLDQYWDSIRGLRQFRLKFSIEGLEADYERIRIGGSWKNFRENLLHAKSLFDARNAQGADWRLYLNYCVMRSNFQSLPDIAEFAVKHNIRLVLNTINGLRHSDENLFAYEWLRFDAETVDRIRGQCESILSSEDYSFSRESRLHLDYIIRAMSLPGLRISPQKLRRIKARWSGQNTDRVLNIRAKWRDDKRGLLLYLWRKFLKRLRLFLRKE